MQPQVGLSCGWVSLPVRTMHWGLRESEPTPPEHPSLFSSSVWNETSSAQGVNVSCSSSVPSTSCPAGTLHSPVGGGWQPPPPIPRGGREPQDSIPHSQLVSPARFLGATSAPPRAPGDWPRAQLLGGRCVSLWRDSVGEPTVPSVGGDESMSPSLAGPIQQARGNMGVSWGP